MQNVSVWVKEQYRRDADIPELVGIYYDPYNGGIKNIINTFISVFHKHEVYGCIEKCR